MNAQDQATLRAEYPEIRDGHWILTREGMTLEQARALMALRRHAFPKTVPLRGNMGPANAALRNRIAVKRTAARLAAETVTKTR